VNFQIVRGEKVALIGKNGVGKSSMLRMIMNQEAYDGELKIGYSVEVGYYAQNQSDILDGEKTVFQTIDDEAVGDIRKGVRGLLGAFLFSGDDIDKKVKVLSGGEKARLAFCKLLLQPYNFLVLDEPTNHLDLASKEVLKNAIAKYDGTVLLVSHDRDFLDGLTQKVFEIQADRMVVFPGDVKEFLRDKKSASIALYENEKGVELVAETSLIDKIVFLNSKDATKVLAAFAVLPDYIDNKPAGFFRVFNDGAYQLILLQKNLVKVSPFDPLTGKNITSFFTKYYYGIYNNGKTIPLKALDRNSILSVIPFNASVEPWIKNTKNKLKSEEDIIALLKYYNSIVAVK
jgi:ABC-type multidrug transport system ATPase subunit